MNYNISIYLNYLRALKIKEITDKINTINRVAYILNKKEVIEKINCFDMKINDKYFIFFVFSFAPLLCN